MAYAANIVDSIDIGVSQPFIQATALSADGSTVVGGVVISDSDSTAADHMEAFRWTQSSGIQTLRAESTIPYRHSWAFGVSSDGHAIVGHRFDQGGDREGFRWTDSTGLVGIGFLYPTRPDDTNESTARVLSPDGTLVYGDGYRWSEPAGMAEFPLYVSAVAANGTVLVGTRITPDGAEAFRWTETTGEIGLGDLPGGPKESFGMAASADGQVVVGMSSISGRQTAFRWTVGLGMQALEDTTGSRATAASATGSIVLGNRSALSGPTAFLWDATHGMRDLRQVLSNGYGLQDELAGWRLHDVVGISLDGKTIAGNGRSPAGRSVAWIIRFDQPLGIPEPNAAALATLPPAALALARRRIPPRAPNHRR